MPFGLVHRRFVIQTVFVFISLSIYIQALFAQVIFPDESRYGVPAQSDSISSFKAEILFKAFQNEQNFMGENIRCNEAAHLWSFLAEKEHGVVTDKIFVLFTAIFKQKPVARNRLRQSLFWNHHVAPLVNVEGEDKVFDAKYLDKPSSIKDWLSELMLQPQDCPVLNDIQPWLDDVTRKRQAKHQCYLIKASRFHYTPIDLERTSKNPNSQPLDWKSSVLSWSLCSYFESLFNRKEGSKARLEQVRKLMGLSSAPLACRAREI
jgi:hypothetical protein